MCGIIGYTGSKKAARVLLNGLKRLEYRGYDSSGIATITQTGIQVIKCIGKIAELEKKTDGGEAPSGVIGIGHTRWATHGAPSDTNSHPHLSADGNFAIVHNGIIENYAELKAELTAQGYTFRSETDSEVIAQLLQSLYDGDIKAALIKVIAKLKGAYAVGIISSREPDALYAIRKDNPLIVGLGENENFIVSDFAAALEHTRLFVHLENGEIARLTTHSALFFDAHGARIEKTPFKVNWDIMQAEKDGYPHFMLKEIYEQPKALASTIGPRVKNGAVVLDNIAFDKKFVSALDKIDIVGCGSAYHAGIVGKYFIEKYCRIPVNCILASEYIYSNPITDGNTLTIVISQSGETADSLAAARLAKQRGSHTLAIVNVMFSAIARESDDVLYMNAGPEISVATTKGYTTQVAALYLVGLNIAKIKGSIKDERYASLVAELCTIPQKVTQTLLQSDAVKDCATRYAMHHCAFFIGRGTDYAASLEGALKLKEISYIHAEAYAAGELKHGTISLIEAGTLALALTTQADLYSKMLSNVVAVRARGGTVLAIASQENKKISDNADITITIPECDDDLSPILTAVILQLFAYYVAVERKCDVDKPRNLAKSVTVE